jgi:serine/threonine protein kinase
MKTDPYKFVDTTLANRYRIEGLLGIGGMAAVYQARHLVTTRVVALKVLKPDIAWQNEAAVGKFINEARAMARLAHPNIVEVMDADLAENGVAFLAMQCLQGETLDRVIERSGPMRPDRVAALLEQLCAGVEHAHNAGIVHRDLKPGNIMIECEGHDEETVKILDFGIARAISGTASTNQPVGTLYYAAPEQLTAGSDLDHRSDIYSLGVILYQMLVGLPPFDDADPMEHVLYQKLHQAPPRMRERRTDLPPDAVPEAAEDVVHKALARHPAQRYQTATELARAFRHAIRLETAALAVECTDGTSAQCIVHASVYLNGKFSGQTDASGAWRRSELPPRPYLIEVETPGHRTWRQTLHIGPNEAAVVRVELERAPRGNLVVVCNVPRATVWLDDKKAGVTDSTGRLPLEDAAAGWRRIRIAHPRHATATGEVEIAAGEASFIELKLAPKPRAVPRFAALGAIGAGALLLFGVLAAPLMRSYRARDPQPRPTPEVKTKNSPRATPTLRAKPAKETPAAAATPSLPPPPPASTTSAPRPLAAQAPNLNPATSAKPIATPAPRPTIQPKPEALSISRIVRPILVDSYDLIKHARVRQFPTWRTVLGGASAKGEITVEVIIDETGAVTPERAASQTAALRQPAVLNAAKDAARKWRFAPFERDGRKISVRGAIVFPVR